MLASLAAQGDGLGFQSGAGPVLIVPAGEMSVDALAAANEDMNVMGRILASALKQAGVAPVGSNVWMGDPFTGGWGGTPTVSQGEGLYLQGYGVLFTMKVGFPLSPEPDSNQPQEKPAQTGGDQVWQQARQQLYEPQATPFGRSNRPSQEARYSAERVENLKTGIITSLKHASNIRGLQPAESVIVTLIGEPLYTRFPTDQFGNVENHQLGDVAYARRLLHPATVLTIRAKMSDVTSFSKGSLSLDQFRQKVQILSEPYLSQRSDSGRIGGRPPAPVSTPSPRR